MNRFFIIIMILGLVCGYFSSQASATTLTYPFSETFETDPFGGNRWAANPTGGIVNWSTAQSNSASHSMYIERTDVSYSYNDPNVLTEVTGIPDTGQFEIKFSFYFDFVDTSNYVHVFALAGNMGNSYSGLTFAVQANSSNLATYFGEQSGGWNSGAHTAIQNGIWYHVRTVIDQDTVPKGSYSVFLAQGSGAEIPYITNAPLGSIKLGAVDNDFIMSFPFVQAKYYLDDISIGAVTVPTPTPSPTPTPPPSPTPTPTGSAYHTIFEEHFSSTLDGSKWIPWDGTHTTSQSLPVDIGGGDFALSLTDSAAGDAGIATVQSFQRAYSIRATFRVWHDATLSYTNVGGPWVVTNDPGHAGYGYPTLNWVEAGICGQDSGQTSGAPFGYAEGAKVFAYALLDQEPFFPFWRNATTKATSVLIRVTLGDVTGALTEYSTDNGATFVGLTANHASGVVLDTRGHAADETIYGYQTVSHNTTLYIGFAGGHTSPTFVDDVLVESLEPQPGVQAVRHWELF